MIESILVSLAVPKSIDRSSTPLSTWHDASVRVAISFTYVSILSKFPERLSPDLGGAIGVASLTDRLEAESGESKRKTKENGRPSRNLAVRS